MPDSSQSLTLRVRDGIDAIAAADWDACAGSANPFLSHAFFKALEDSKSAVGETGWMPQHLVVEDEAGKVMGCAPLYVKTHSYGEYVFDWGWAEAFQRAGGRYYPKLLCGVPFTPVPGPRFLIRPGAPEEMPEILMGGMLQMCEKLNLSSLHINFCTEAEWKRCGEAGMLLRVGKQFHWENAGYATFDDFLKALASRKRKAVRKERQAVVDAGIVVSSLVGDAIQERHWDAFFDFYMDTGDRKWGQAYLNRAFFSRLHDSLAHRVLLVMAEKDGRPVGGALNMIGEDTLYGRYWGCLETYKFLHFEACYYRAIDYAIEHKMARVEAGAGGRHKLQRGYMAKPTYSAHWITHSGLRNAVAQFLEQEREAVDDEIAHHDEHSPFRHEQGE
jgi:predicted N-acyltransferase